MIGHCVYAHGELCACSESCQYQAWDESKRQLCRFGGEIDDANKESKSHKQKHDWD